MKRVYVYRYTQTSCKEYKMELQSKRKIIYEIYKWMPITISDSHALWLSNRDLTDEEFNSIIETPTPLKYDYSSPSKASIPPTEE